MANTTGKDYLNFLHFGPNRMTKELRSVLKDVLFEELGEIKEKLNMLEPKERLELLIKLIPYVLPKVNSVSHTTNEPMDWDL